MDQILEATLPESLYRVACRDKASKQAPGRALSKRATFNAAHAAPTVASSAAAAARGMMPTIPAAKSLHNAILPKHLRPAPFDGKRMLYLDSLAERMEVRMRLCLNV